MLHYTTRHSTLLVLGSTFPILHGAFRFGHSTLRIRHAKLTISFTPNQNANHGPFYIRVFVFNSLKYRINSDTVQLAFQLQGEFSFRCEGTISIS